MKMDSVKGYVHVKRASMHTFHAKFKALIMNILRKYKGALTILPPDVIKIRVLIVCPMHGEDSGV